MISGLKPLRLRFKTYEVRHIVTNKQYGAFTMPTVKVPRSFRFINAGWVILHAVSVLFIFIIGCKYCSGEWANED